MSNDPNIIATDSANPVKDKLIRYSEIFGGNGGTQTSSQYQNNGTFQGEGKYTGHPTAWVRFFACNFTCDAFGQKNIGDPSTWELPRKDFDTSLIKTIEELPVFHTGCDSAYSYASKFLKFAHKNTAKEIAQKLIDLNKSPYNPSGSFEHERSKQETHMAFTGGEPMMNQRAIVDIMEEMHALNKNSPVKVTVETNGTQELKDDFKTFLSKRFYRYENVGGMMSADRAASSEWFWSISPKIRTSGEKWEDAIKPEVVASYAEISPYGQLKFVVDNDPLTWYEVEEAVKLYREAGCNFPVYIMPVGADVEMQESHQAIIARECVARGYIFCARVHTLVLGNGIGT
jgi:7-carboxy-7-deazaguanine synthase